MQLAAEMFLSRLWKCNQTLYIYCTYNCKHDLRMKMCIFNAEVRQNVTLIQCKTDAAGLLHDLG